MLERLRLQVARWIAPPPPPGRRIASRAYAGARGSRLTAGFGSSSNMSADAELALGLTQLRARSRQLMRDAPYARRARAIIINNVVGAGIGMQAQVMTSRGELAQRINEGIEREWRDWCRATACHTGGALHFNDFQRTSLGEIVTAGEGLVRKHSRRFGDSRVPFALELVESERLADEYQTPSAISPDLDVRMGVEVDLFGRAAGYWLRERHPGDLRYAQGSPQRFIRVPAESVVHVHRIDRWPQTRGEPWLHTVLRRLNDMDEYTSAELIAAKMAANYFATIKSAEEDPLPGAKKQDDGTKQLEIEPGMIEQLSPGDELDFHAPNRPNTALDGFMRFMLREVASGTDVSYESVSRDYSQSNYSSSRLSLLDDRDNWRVLQQWFIRSFLEPIYREWLQAAVLSRAIPEISLESYGADPDKFRAVLWKPRGWSWVDPTKEVEAYREAVRCGFMTVSDVITATGDGRDLEDLLNGRRHELDAMAEKKLVFDTDPTIVAPAPAATVDPAAAPAEPAATDPQQPARVVPLREVSHA